MSFDFTPPAGSLHGQFHPTISNTDFISALNDEYNNNTAEWEEKLPPGYKPSSDPTGYWTAAMTLGSWYAQQLPGCNGTGCSANNPYSVPFSNTQKQNFLQGLGNNCDPSSLFESYNAQPNGARYSPALANTYFNLGQGEKAFTWENGSLCITDRYTFEGVADFGVGASTIDNPNSVSGWINWGAKMIVVAGLVLTTGTAAAVVRGMLSKFTGNLGDASDPFTRGMRGDDPIGNVAPLFLKNCFSPEDLCSYNKNLFTCAVRSGKTSSSDGGGVCFNGQSCIEVGAAQPAPLLGFPSYAPYVTSITLPTGFTFGGGGDYPKPFTSFSQRIVDANYSLGPYAKFGDLSGRLVTITSGPNSGELGFICQPWYGFNDGTYARDSNLELYPTKAKWWDTCIKEEIEVRFLPFSTQPMVKVLVAVESFQSNNSPNVYSTSYPIEAAPLASITLTTLINSAALVATLTLI